MSAFDVHEAIKRIARMQQGDTADRHSESSPEKSRVASDQHQSALFRLPRELLEQISVCLGDEGNRDFRRSCQRAKSIADTMLQRYLTIEITSATYFRSSLPSRDPLQSLKQQEHIKELTIYPIRPPPFLEDLFHGYEYTTDEMRSGFAARVSKLQERVPDVPTQLEIGLRGIHTDTCRILYRGHYDEEYETPLTTEGLNSRIASRLCLQATLTRDNKVDNYLIRDGSASSGKNRYHAGKMLDNGNDEMTILSRVVGDVLRRGQKCTWVLRSATASGPDGEGADPPAGFDTETARNKVRDYLNLWQNTTFSGLSSANGLTVADLTSEEYLTFSTLTHFSKTRPGQALRSLT